MRGGCLGNHWFWVTILAGLVVNCASDSLLKAQNEAELHNFQEGEDYIPLVAGARGGRVLVIPPPGDHNSLALENNKNMKVSKSVSKVSVMMGNISEKQGGGDEEVEVVEEEELDYPDQQLSQQLVELPGGYHDREQLPSEQEEDVANPRVFYYNLEETAPQHTFSTLEQQLHHQQQQQQQQLHRQQYFLLPPQSPSYRWTIPPPPNNSPHHHHHHQQQQQLQQRQQFRRRLESGGVYGGAAAPPPRPQWRQQAALSRAGMGRRLDGGATYNLVYLQPETPVGGNTQPAPPRAQQPPPPRYSFLGSIISKLKALALATKAASMRVSTNHLSNDIEELSGDIDERVPVEEFPEQETEPTNQQQQQQHEETERTTDTRQEGEVVQEETETAAAAEDLPGRSSYARGRSLPISILEKLVRQPQEEKEEVIEARVWEQTSQLGEAEKMEEEVIVEEERVGGLEKEIVVEEEEEEVRMIPEAEQAEVRLVEVLEEDGGFQALVDGAGEEVSVRIEEELPIVSISSIVGMVLGVVIFILLAAVFLLLAVYRNKRKTKKVQDDTVSQSSYLSNLSASTTLSDTTVNFGPAWDKDIGGEDLCSLDNDSFLNSLEAVTAEYWVDKKVDSCHQ